MRSHRSRYTQLAALGLALSAVAACKGRTEADRATGEAPAADTAMSAGIANRYGRVGLRRRAS